VCDYIHISPSSPYIPWRSVLNSTRTPPPPPGGEGGCVQNAGGQIASEGVGGTGSSNGANSSSYCLRGFSAFTEMLVASGEKAQAMLASASEVADVWRVAVTATVSLLCVCATPTNHDAAVPHAAQNESSSPPTSAPSPSSRAASSKHSTSPASPHLPDLAFDILPCEHTAVAHTAQNNSIADTVKDAVFSPPPPSQLSYSSAASS